VVLLRLSDLPDLGPMKRLIGTLAGFSVMSWMRVAFAVLWVLRCSSSSIVPRLDFRGGDERPVILEECGRRLLLPLRRRMMTVRHIALYFWMLCEFVG